MDPTRNPNSGQNDPPTTDDDYEHRFPLIEPPIEAEELNSKEAMFEKPLTPSDVGKLNRLVIPKHHAERHFPLGADDSAAGMQLGFEDEAGQCWWFRYSYWNSSQSYVLTKGWRRYVKEKRLHAGDVVLFERHRSHPERLFINWRPREAAPPTYSPALAHLVGLTGYRQHYQSTGGGQAKEEEKATGVSSAINNSRSGRLVRLFGVNLECQHKELHPAEDLP